jgi:hypothetical protein
LSKLSAAKGELSPQELYRARQEYMPTDERSAAERQQFRQRVAPGVAYQTDEQRDVAARKYWTDKAAADRAAQATTRQPAGSTAMAPVGAPAGSQWQYGPNNIPIPTGPDARNIIDRTNIERAKGRLPLIDSRVLDQLYGTQQRPVAQAAPVNPDVAPQREQAPGVGGTVERAAGAMGIKAPPPRVGEVRQGYRFKGGDPNDRMSWERA